MIDQALDYLDRFVRSNDLLIHFNWCSIKERDFNITLDGQDGFKMGHKFENKCAKITVNLNQSINWSNWPSKVRRIKWDPNISQKWTAYL